MNEIKLPTNFERLPPAAGEWAPTQTTGEAPPAAPSQPLPRPPVSPLTPPTGPVPAAAQETPINQRQLRRQCLERTSQTLARFSHSPHQQKQALDQCRQYYLKHCD